MTLRIMRNKSENRAIYEEGDWVRFYPFECSRRVGHVEYGQIVSVYPHHAGYEVMPYRNFFPGMEGQTWPIIQEWVVGQGNI